MGICMLTVKIYVDVSTWDEHLGVKEADTSFGKFSCELDIVMFGVKMVDKIQELFFRAIKDAENIVDVS